jgi:hypothetical protein
MPSSTGARSSAGSEQQWWRPDVPRTLAQEGEPHGAPRLPTRGRSSRASGLSWSARARLATANHFHDDGQVRADASAGPARPAPCSDLGRRRVGRGYGGQLSTPAPAIPAGGCLAHRRAPLPHSGRTADAGTHGHRTATPDTDTWTLRHPHRTPDAWTGTCGHWTLALDTGHRTLAEDADRVTTARPASGPPGPTTPSDRSLGRLKCSCGRRLQRSAAHAGSA